MKYWQLFLHFLLVICTFQVARPINILSLIATPEEKHYKWYGVLHEALVARNHNLTIVSTYAEGPTTSRMWPIKFELSDTHPVKEFPYTLGEEFSGMSNLNSWYQAQEDHCKHIMEGSAFDNAVAELLNTPPKIDLILYDITFDPWCVLMIADLYRNVSIFALSAFKALPEHFEIARGGLASPGVTPSFISYYSENMGFFERYWNAMLYWYGYYLKFHSTAKNIAEFVENNPIVRKYGLPGTLANVMSRIKLIFVNSHPAIDYSIPLPPNIIEIGGMHVRKLAKLDYGAQEFIKRTGNNLIYIDLGKYMTVKKLGPKIINDIVNVIRRNHDHVFLWNIKDADLIENRPNHLIAQTNFQRNEILAHPKIKLFITEADHLNIQESIYFGVPLVVIPLNMDQPNNAVRVEERKFGHHILYHDINATNFHRIIVDTLNCYECTKSVQMAQRAFHSNPNKPLDTVIGWIENEAVLYPDTFDYIVSRSAEHRGYAATHSYDIVFSNIGIILFIIGILVCICCTCCNCCKCCRRAKKSTPMDENPEKQISDRRKQAATDYSPVQPAVPNANRDAELGLNNTPAGVSFPVQNSAALPPQLADRCTSVQVHRSDENNYYSNFEAFHSTQRKYDMRERRNAISLSFESGRRASLTYGSNNVRGGDIGAGFLYALAGNPFAHEPRLLSQSHAGIPVYDFRSSAASDFHLGRSMETSFNIPEMILTMPTPDSVPKILNLDTPPDEQKPTTSHAAQKAHAIYMQKLQSKQISEESTSSQRAFDDTSSSIATASEHVLADASEDSPLMANANSEPSEKIASAHTSNKNTIQTHFPSSLELDEEEESHKKIASVHTSDETTIHTDFTSSLLDEESHNASDAPMRRATLQEPSSTSSSSSIHNLQTRTAPVNRQSRSSSKHKRYKKASRKNLTQHNS